VDMREVVDDALTGMSQVFSEKGIQIKAQFPEHVAPVSADVDRVIQVLLNLLSNAVKFCDPGRGRIEVSLAASGDEVRVDVRDNGPGISERDQEIIFEKFRQAGDTLTDKPQGTGLGLPISRQIIEHLGGRLWVESRPGAGACFSFTLPVLRQESGQPSGQVARAA